MVKELAKNEIKDEQLEQVNGGLSVYTLSHSDNYRYVGKYDLVIGRKYYMVTCDACDSWMYGTCTDTWEKKRCAGTRRMHKMLIEDASGMFYNPYNGHELVFDGDTTQVFEAVN